MADETHRLHQEIQAARRLRENLASLMEDDPQLIADSLEGETNIHEAIEAAVTLYFNDNAFITAIDNQIAVLETRKNRLKKRTEVIRAMVCVALDQAGKKTVETALGTATLKNTPRQLLLDPDQQSEIPLEYWKAGEPKLDKKKLKADIETGKTVKGATLSNGGQSIQFSFK